MNKTVLVGLGATSGENTLSLIQQYLTIVSPAQLTLSYNDILDAAVITISERDFSVRHVIPLGEIAEMSNTDYFLIHLTDMRKELDTHIANTRGEVYKSLGVNAAIKTLWGNK